MDSKHAEIVKEIFQIDKEESRFHDQIGNLEFLVGDDLAAGVSLPFLATPEERAFNYLSQKMNEVWNASGQRKFNPGFFLKHVLKSHMGTHCIFGIRYMDYEVDEQSFVVHVDAGGQIVMMTSTYLPELPRLLEQAAQWQIVDITDEINNAHGPVQVENMWLIDWLDQAEQGYPYRIVPGRQVKSTLKINDEIQVATTNIYSGNRKKTYYTTAAVFPSAPGRKMGIGKIIKGIETNRREYHLDDVSLGEGDLTSGILRDLDEGSELRGRYAVIRDDVNPYRLSNKGDFTGFTTHTMFDRVMAYYHLDQVQRFFREQLGLYVLASYPKLNPQELVLSPVKSSFLSSTSQQAYYDSNLSQIVFRKFGKGIAGYTAVRDPRYVYHEFAHAVTDALARLRRGNKEPAQSKRLAETIQAAAMDEGLAYYFCCSLAARQGASRPIFYKRSGKAKWSISFYLNPVKPKEAQIPYDVTSNSLQTVSEIDNWIYGRAILWARCLWQLREQLGGDVADTLIAHSIFFLTRWATFEQGAQALLLANSLLFFGKEGVGKAIKDEISAKIDTIRC